jgi:hypothetical protein
MPEYDITTEFYIDGEWISEIDGIDLSARVRAEAGILISRGYKDQQSNLSAQTSEFTLNTRDGLFSKHNPNSPLFRKLQKNTKVRHIVGTREIHAVMPWAESDDVTIQTTDKAVLDITGDIDIRMELTPASWRPNIPQILASKYVTSGNQRSWTLRLLNTGRLQLAWTADGSTILGLTSDSAAPIPVDSGRLAIRVTFDVNNGGGGCTATFYTASAIDGSWVALGAAQTTTPTTSIFNSTAPLELGAGNNGGSPFTGSMPATGKLWAFELYNGIGGTLVASFDPDQAASVEATSWSDGLGTPNTWSVTDSAYLASDQIRFTGELKRIPHSWDATGQDVFARVRAAGPLQRIMKGGQPIRSAIYRHLIQYTAINGYWPMEAAAGSTIPDSAVAGATSNIPDASWTGFTPDGFEGSAGAVRLNSSDSRIYLATPGRTSTTEASFLAYFKLESLPATEKMLMSVRGNGTGGTVDILVGPTSFAFNIYDSTGTLLDTGGALHGSGASPLDQWVGMQFFVQQEGANVRWQTLWHAVGTETFYTHFSGGDTFVGTVGRFNGALLDARQDAAFVGAEFAHIQLTRDVQQINTSAFALASRGHRDETAGRRIIRIANEEGLEVEMLGDPDDTEALGPQLPNTTTEIFMDAAQVDGGILADSRSRLAMQYVTRRYLGEQQKITLDYSAAELSLLADPTDDDDYVLNDLTMSRPDGTTVRLEIEDGPNGTATIERIPGPLTRNASDDAQLSSLVEWEGFWRTWDAFRVPAMGFDFHRTQILNDATLTSRLQEADVGTLFNITNLPSFLQPDDMLLAGFGYTERINRHTWSISFNTVPGGPYVTYLLDSTEEHARMDSEEDQSVLNASLDTTATSFVIKTIDGNVGSEIRWINTTDHSAEFPIDVDINGERITISAITVGAASGNDWTQTATVSARSVNGIVKAHAAGDEIRLYVPSYLTLGA